MTNFGATVRVVRFEPVDQPALVEQVALVEPLEGVEPPQQVGAEPVQHVQPVGG